MEQPLSFNSLSDVVSNRVCIVMSQTVTAWKIEKVLLHIELKRPTISTHFQRPLKELENSISGVRRRRQKVDGFSNNKRSNGSNTHPLKSAILRSRASWSEVRPLRSDKRGAYLSAARILGPLGLSGHFFRAKGRYAGFHNDKSLRCVIFG